MVGAIYNVGYVLGPFYLGYRFTVVLDPEPATELLCCNLLIFGLGLDLEFGLGHVRLFSDQSRPLDAGYFIVVVKFPFGFLRLCDAAHIIYIYDL